MSDQKERSRLTVTYRIYHQLNNEDPTQVSDAYARPLQHDDEPYQRRKLKVGNQARIPLDCGWLQGEQAGCFVIENTSGQDSEIYPTEDERREINQRVIRVFLSPGDTSGLFVPPGQSRFIQPFDTREVRLISAHGTARYNLTVFPK